MTKFGFTEPFKLAKTDAINGAQAVLNWPSTQCSRIIDTGETLTSTYLQAESLVLANGDQASVGSDVIIRGIDDCVRSKWNKIITILILLQGYVRTYS